MPRTDVVIAWAFAPVPDSAKAAFQRPTTFVVLPTPPGQKYVQQVSAFTPSPLRGILKKYAPGVEPLRIAALGFSQSCQGPGALLRSADGGHLNAAVAVDGIHVGTKQIPEDAMPNWVSFARLAAVGERLCVVTHSSVVPPNYASTTQTADFIWRRAAETTDEVAIPPVPDLDAATAAAPYTTTVGSPPLPPGAAPYTVSYADLSELAQAPRRANGLVVLGWDNKDAAGYADHRRQAKQVLPVVVESFLAARWNAIDPDDPGAGCYAG